MISYFVKDDITDDAEAHSLWDFYLKVFGPLAKLAVNRHVMTRAEFDGMLSDRRIEKHIAMNDLGRVLGFSVITNRLDRWPLVSPEYFAARHPREYAAGHIWYVGFVGTLPNGLSVFQGLLDSMTAGRRDNGLFYMDFCAYNVDRRIVALCERRLAGIDSRVTMRRADDQSFWLTTFGAEG
jgi:hypothetical protein